MKERNQEIHVLFLPDEMERLKQKMSEVGIINRSNITKYATNFCLAQLGKKAADA